MNNKLAKRIRKTCKIKPELAYKEQTFHWVVYPTGKFLDNNEPEMNTTKITDPIKLDYCNRKLYKDKKRQYANQNNIQR